MAHEVSRTSKSSLENLWASMEAQNEPEVERKQDARAEPTSLFLSLFVESSVRTVNWVIENRGGFAWLTGLVMVPSQFLGPKAARANQVIADMAESDDFQLERFSLSVKDSGELP